MLGLVVARISGRRFAKFLDERIFRPLHMARTLVYLGGRTRYPIVPMDIPRARVDSQRRIRARPRPLRVTAAFIPISKNLAKWVAALESHTLLSENEMRPALTPVTLNDGSQPHWPVDANDDNLHPGQPVAYGFGWFLDPFKGRARMWPHRRHDRLSHREMSALRARS